MIVPCASHAARNGLPHPARQSRPRGLASQRTLQLVVALVGQPNRQGCTQALSRTIHIDIQSR